MFLPSRQVNKKIRVFTDFQEPFDDQKDELTIITGQFDFDQSYLDETSTAKPVDTDNVIIYTGTYHDEVRFRLALPHSHAPYVPACSAALA